MGVWGTNRLQVLDVALQGPMRLLALVAVQMATLCPDHVEYMLDIFLFGLELEGKLGGVLIFSRLALMAGIDLVGHGECCSRHDERVGSPR